MSAHKKNWVFRNGISNAKYSFDANHGDQGCTGCHGGTDGVSDRATAHGGSFDRIPGSSRCSSCHAQHGDEAALANGSLHTTVAGYEVILGARGFDLSAGTESRARYDKQCTRCHAAVQDGATTEAACGQCHVSVPDGAGGGLVAGHRMSRTPDTVNQCTACHGSRVKDEYFGLNGALYARNRQYSALGASDPFGGTLVPDVHRERAGYGCDACHGGGEMHGSGTGAGVDRYGVAGRTQCTTCHTPSTSVGLHSTKHLAAMSCQVCHAQPYKSCFSCHTQETAGAAWFENNVTDPTRAARYVFPDPWLAGSTYALGQRVTFAGTPYESLQAGNTNQQPDLSASWTAIDALAPGDALITFRVGRNPRFGEPGAKKYAVLRHVPVDADTFTYTEDGTMVPDLIPSVAALPTWKYATPHNIVRRTAITADPDGAGPQSECGNCHSSRYAAFWLTDSHADSFGWVPEFQSTTWEAGANADVVQPAHPTPTLD